MGLLTRHIRAQDRAMGGDLRVFAIVSVDFGSIPALPLQRLRQRAGELKRQGGEVPGDLSGGGAAKFGRDEVGTRCAPLSSASKRILDVEERHDKSWVQPAHRRSTVPIPDTRLEERVEGRLRTTLNLSAHATSCGARQGWMPGSRP